MIVKIDFFSPHNTSQSSNHAINMLYICFKLTGKESILEELSVLLAPVIDKTEFSRQMDNSRVVRKEVRMSHLFTFKFVHQLHH